MLTVDDYLQIRLAHRDGLSVRQIAKRLKHSRRKVRDVLRHPEPRPYTRQKPPRAPKLGPFHGIIDEILTADEAAPPKQRHTAKQIHRRLVQEHGYSGGYDQVRRYVGRTRRRSRETFLPLVFGPGQRVECDFGQIYVDFPQGRQAVPVLLVTWAYSYCPFAIALPTERTEAILHGMQEAFAFFGCVPREVWWDNPTTVAVEILAGRRRKLQERYQALASHYRFEPLFCQPARGNEKPHVENRVKDLQRRWATPVPQVRDLAELNAYLRDCCLTDRERVATGRTETIGVRFAEEQAAALPLPERSFDACLSRPAVADKYQTVRFDNNRYSVPRTAAFQAVTVKGYVDRVEIVAAGAVIARHPRSYGRGEQILDPLHFLVMLSRKPACLDHTAVYRDWRLPEAFTTLRQRLEQQHGLAAGARQFIRVLSLLNEHPLPRVAQAVQEVGQGTPPNVPAILERVRRWRAQELPTALEDLSSPASATVDLAAVHVPRPDLARFNELLSAVSVATEESSAAAVSCAGEPSDVRPGVAVVEDEPQGAPAPHDVCGV